MKQKYSSPRMNILELCVESLLATSIGEIPVKPNVPAVPASFEGSVTKSSDECWKYEW